MNKKRIVRNVKQMAINAICILICMTIFVYALLDGIDREVVRRCLDAIDHCEKYADVGACESQYFKVCEGVEL